MNISVDLIKIILFLFPGLVCSFFLNKLSISGKIEFNKYIVNIVSQSLIVYILTFSIDKFFFLIFKLHIIIDENFILYYLLKTNTQTINFNLLELFISILIATILGITLAKLKNNKYFFILAQKMKLTEKLGDSKVWETYLDEIADKQFVIRDISNNLTYYGKLKYYSDSTEEFQELVLEQAKIYKSSTSELLYSVKEIYISGKKENLRLEKY